MVLLKRSNHRFSFTRYFSFNKAVETARNAAWVVYNFLLDEPQELPTTFPVPLSTTISVSPPTTPPPPPRRPPRRVRFALPSPSPSVESSPSQSPIKSPSPPQSPTLSPKKTPETKKAAHKSNSYRRSAGQPDIERGSKRRRFRETVICHARRIRRIAANDGAANRSFVLNGLVEPVYAKDFVPESPSLSHVSTIYPDNAYEFPDEAKLEPPSDNGSDLNANIVQSQDTNPILLYKGKWLANEIRKSYLWFRTVHTLVSVYNRTKFKLAHGILPSTLVLLVVNGWISLEAAISWADARETLGKGLMEFMADKRYYKIRISGSVPTEKEIQDYISGFTKLPKRSILSTREDEFEYDWVEDAKILKKNGVFGKECLPFAEPDIQESVLKILLDPEISPFDVKIPDPLKKLLLPLLVRKRAVPDVVPSNEPEVICEVMVEHAQKQSEDKKSTNQHEVAEVDESIRMGTKRKHDEDLVESGSVADISMETASSTPKRSRTPTNEGLADLSMESVEASEGPDPSGAALFGAPQPAPQPVFQPNSQPQIIHPDPVQVPSFGTKIASKPSSPIMVDSPSSVEMMSPPKLPTPLVVPSTVVKPAPSVPSQGLGDFKFTSSIQMPAAPTPPPRNPEVNMRDANHDPRPRRPKNRQNGAHRVSAYRTRAQIAASKK